MGWISVGAAQTSGTSTSYYYLLASQVASTANPKYTVYTINTNTGNESLLLPPFALLLLTQYFPILLWTRLLSWHIVSHFLGALVSTSEPLSAVCIGFPQFIGWSRFHNKLYGLLGTFQGDYRTVEIDPKTGMTIASSSSLPLFSSPCRCCSLCLNVSLVHCWTLSSLHDAGNCNSSPINLGSDMIVVDTAFLDTTRTLFLAVTDNAGFFIVTVKATTG